MCTAAAATAPTPSPVIYEKYERVFTASEMGAMRYSRFAGDDDFCSYSSTRISVKLEKNRVIRVFVSKTFVGIVFCVEIAFVAVASRRWKF